MKCLLPGLSVLLLITGNAVAAPGREAVVVSGFTDVLKAAADFSEEESAALAQTVAQFGKRSDPEDFAAWDDFLKAYPYSAHRVSILTNVGIAKFRIAKFSECLDAFEQAWDAGKDIEDPNLNPVVGRAVGELAQMYARLGRYESLERLLQEVGGRSFRGPGNNLLDDARTGFAMMKSRPAVCFRCGPMAVSRILAVKGESNFLPPVIKDSVSTREGIAFDKVAEIAVAAGLDYKVVKRSPGAPVITPSVIHWKVGHYAAIVRSVGDRYEIEDPTFEVNTGFTATRATLDAEASGYFLVPAGPLPPGWSEVPKEEAAAIFGKGQTTGADPGTTKPSDKKAKPPESDGDNGCGMAVWNFHLLLCSLNIVDTPLSYEPPLGPSVGITATYNSREWQSFTEASHTNFGSKWNLSAIAWLNDATTTVTIQGGHGGTEVFYRDQPIPATYHRERSSYSLLETIGTNAWRRTFVDGTREKYERVGPTGAVYRTELEDPTGKKLTFGYTVSTYEIRLSTITDALGQVTTFEYGSGTLHPTKITDPFGRFATFQYNAAGQLTSITDPVGIVSQFAYKPSSDFISAMITPYGETRFDSGQVEATRWIQATHPNGDLERAEFRHFGEGIASQVPGPQQPQGMLVSPDYYHFRNSFYWDRKAMKMGPGEIPQARLTHFLHTSNPSVASGVVESEKAPLEGRVWYNYQGQTDPIYEPPLGGGQRVTKIGRVLDDGSTQLVQYEYNAAGKVTKLTDALGRTTDFIYAANLRDLIEVRQKTGATSYDILGKWTYNAAGKPLTSTDPAGRVSTNTYHANGKPETITDVAGRILTMNYNANGYLTRVDGPLPGTADSTQIAYDSAGRIATITDSLGSVENYAYDNLDRIVRITDGDGEYEEVTFEALRVKTARQRGGRMVTYKYNALKEMIEAKTSDGITTLFEWCRCGAIQGLIDNAGNTTRYEYDVQGRMVSKTMPDGGKILVAYQPASGRVSKITDERGASRDFSYFKDNRLSGIGYSGAGPSTPGVTFTWDPIYPRMTSFTDGIGVTSMQYTAVALGENGVGDLASIDGPLPNDTITYTRDVLGRVTSRAIGGNVVSRTYDALGRMSSTTNPLGAFTYTFLGNSPQVASVTSPNGIVTMLQYFGPSGMQRLKDIIHTGPASAAISKFSFAYDSKIQPTSITRQIGSGPLMQDTPSYDSAMRLTGYQKSLSGGGTQAFAYSYDALANRVTESINGVAATDRHNMMNQLTDRTPATASLRTYEWDAAGRITAIIRGSMRTEITYDGLGRRARIVEKDANVVVQDRRFVWDLMEIAEERDAAGVVVKRYFPQGFTTAAGSFYYTRDHLGSIREITDSTGTVRARFDYDPYGRRTRLSGDMDSDFGFTGHWQHAGTGLVMTWARMYDPDLGRWLSRDPYGEAQGLNLYAYQGGNPISARDPWGMAADSGSVTSGGAAAAIYDGVWAFGEMAQSPGVGMFVGAVQTGFAVAALGAAIIAAPGLGAVGATILVGTAVYGVGTAAWSFTAPLVNEHMGTDWSGGAIVDFMRWKTEGRSKCDGTEELAMIADTVTGIAAGGAGGLAMTRSFKSGKYAFNSMGGLVSSPRSRAVRTRIGERWETGNAVIGTTGFAIGGVAAASKGFGTVSASW